LAFLSFAWPAPSVTDVPAFGRYLSLESPFLPNAGRHGAQRLVRASQYHVCTIAPSPTAGVDENQAVIRCGAGLATKRHQKRKRTLESTECPKDPFCPEGWEEISKRVS
jgi:hypothetical protein